MALAQLRHRFHLLPSLAQDLQFQRDRATVSHDGFSCPTTAVKRLSLCGACSSAAGKSFVGACAYSNRPPSAGAEIPAVTHAPLLRRAQLATHLDAAFSHAVQRPAAARAVRCFLGSPQSAHTR